MLMELGRTAKGHWDAATASATLSDLVSQVDLQPLKKPRLRRRHASDVLSDLVEAVLRAYREEKQEEDAVTSPNPNPNLHPHPNLHHYQCETAALRFAWCPRSSP